MKEMVLYYLQNHKDYNTLASKCDIINIKTGTKIRVYQGEIIMEKIYSELTKQSYYSEEAKEADEKVYKEQMAEKEKAEQVLKETREARVKEYNEAVNKLAALKDEYDTKYEEKYNQLAEELEKAKQELNKEYLEKRKPIIDVIDQFNKDYPNGIYISYRKGKPAGALERILDNFFSDPFFINPFPYNVKRLK